MDEGRVQRRRGPGIKERLLNGRRSITADTALRLGRYFGNAPQFWLDLQSRYDIAVIEIQTRRVRPADAA